jgi:hypothetical protein
MILRKFSLFKENQKYNSIGEQIEDLVKDDEYLLMLVSNYLDSKDTDVRLANAVNTLDHFEANQLLNRILKVKSKGEDVKDPEVLGYVKVTENIDAEVVVGGKSIFKSFLKLITSLGLKEIQVDWKKCPKNYLFYIHYENIDSIVLKSVINSRFKSLSHISDKLDYTKNECHLYYGLNTDMIFEYGIISETNKNLGLFKVNKSNFDWLLTLDSLSFLNFKKHLVHFTFDHILLFAKLKKDIEKFLGKEPEIKFDNNHFVIKYKSHGKWSDGIIDDEYLVKFKEDFKNWFVKYKWSTNFLYRVEAINNEIIIFFKIK